MNSADFVSAKFIAEHLENIIQNTNINIMACIDEPHDNGLHNAAVVSISGKGACKDSEIFTMWELLTAKTIEEMSRLNPNGSKMIKALFFKKFLDAIADPEKTEK